MDILQLYQDFSVDHKTEGHKHTRPGWVNVECPWCTGNPGYHLGYNLQGNFYFCWRCGYHKITPTISKLIHVPEKEAYHLIKGYGLLIPKSSKEHNVKIRAKAHRLPSGVMPLQRQHVRYLQERNFDSDYIVSLWHIMATGPVSMLDHIDYKHRIIIPYIWNGEQVSFDARDITDKSNSKYMACPKDRELIPHKDILYGDQSKWSDTGICVEGPTDVWRLGVHSFATSGIKYTNQQVRQMAKAFKRIAVVFDDDPQAIVQSKLLVAQLKYRGVDAFRIDIEGDPGSMKQEDANYFVKQLIR